MARKSFDGSASVMDALAPRVATRFKQGLTFPREFHLPPEVRGKPPTIQPEGTDLYIWTWEKDHGQGMRYYGIAFAGKSNKPLWHYAFRNEAQRQEQIERTTTARKSVMKMKQDRLDERRNYKHDYKEGDILYASWGYDQTNIDFYQVVAVVESMVAVREIGQKVVSENQNISKVVAVPDKFIGPPLKRKPGVGGYVKIDSVKSAHRWDGKPVYQTSSGWGH